MTRPRMAGAASSCRVELMLAANVTLAAPVTASATSSRPSVGAAAATRLNAPKAKAASASSLESIRSRVPEASAPVMAPTAIAAVSAAYVPAVP
jgi:hypothetical protein